VPAYGPQNDVTLKMPAFEWVHVQLHQQKGMISLSPPTICNSAVEPLHTPGVVVYQHGPFAWGKDAHDAVHNAVVMEEVAKMAWIARGINPALSPIDSYLMNKHFMRKHGPNAYYGQK
ncbi:class II aldolase/adducin family protein, partial [Citrobacter freundii]|uniref:class II aldolase/adducin family protein n=1 Tax=Citrobacter freundii TaxID=546 RepID=UPI00374FDAFE